MDRKEKIIRLIDFSGGRLIELYKKFKDESARESTYEEWNVRDILGHINFWWDYSLLKLNSMIKKELFDEIKNFEKKNREIYNDVKNIPIETIVDNLKNIYLPVVWGHRGLICRLTKKQLQSKDYPTGFPFELWRYVVREFFIHPYMHICYYYLRKGLCNSFTEIVTSAESSFLEYSNGDMSVFSFENYYTDGLIKNNDFKRLKEYNKNIDNSVLEKIIGINLHE
jgi:hypothetical protein